MEILNVITVPAPDLDNPDLPVSVHVAVALLTFMAALFVAYAALKLYDEPVRNYLKEHWLKK
ncbi:MAG: hypothetical protein KBT08_07275 [Bacteroidales bacterium]|nr:hypothetical protein [Candidatus Cryptobacteroides onthequi]